MCRPAASRGVPQADKAFAVGAGGDTEEVEAGAAGAVGAGSDPFGGALGGLGGLGGAMGGLGGGMPGGMPPGVTPEMYQKMMKVCVNGWCFRVALFGFAISWALVGALVKSKLHREQEGGVDLARLDQTRG